VLNDLRVNERIYPQPLTRWLGLVALRMDPDDKTVPPNVDPRDSAEVLARCASPIVQTDLNKPLLFHEGSTSEFHIDVQKIESAFKGYVSNHGFLDCVFLICLIVVSGSQWLR
jgi:hypothetical protein